ncbi:MAG: LLM class flavin-dependent oxidoreductase [Actinomycetota bacterium]
MSAPAPPSVGYLVPTREAIMSGEPETGRLIALAERAEALGYQSIWVGDSITSRPRHEPLTMLTAIAMRTTSAILGTAVLLPALRQPVAMAHQVATLDRLAEGRVVLGVGIGGDSPSNRAEFAALGLDFERRLGRMNEHLDLCRKLWSGEPVEHHGEFYTVDNASIGPSTHTPGGPPLWVTGSSEPGQRRAGSRYDGWMPIGPIDVFTAGLPVVQEAARAAGRDPGEVTASTYLTISLDDDTNAAEQTLNDFLDAYYPAPPEVMRKFQACYAGPRAGLIDWVAPFVEAGAEHLILRFAGNHDTHLEACSTLGAELG